MADTDTPDAPAEKGQRSRKGPAWLSRLLGRHDN